MRIVSLHVHGFGAVVDQELKFSDGLNIVSGPNEIGKSTWHTAATLLLTGLPPSRLGKFKQVLDRYEPWSGGTYRVSGEVELDDGRRLHLMRDFATRRSEVYVIGAGKQKTAITSDASHDLAELIGLDRSTLPLVASVRQTEILQLQDDEKDKAALREFLQRTLATRNVSDASAEAALDAIKAFRSDKIGSDRTNSTKPLMQAKRALQEAEDDYRDGVERWNELQARELQLSVDARRRDELVEELTAARCFAKNEELEHLRSRVQEVEAIDAELGLLGGVTAPHPEQFAEAERLWATRGEAALGVDDETKREVVERCEKLDTEIASLANEREEGPDSLSSEVMSLRTKLDDRLRRLQLVAEARPGAVEPVGQGSATELRRMAAELAQPLAPVEAGLGKTIHRLKGAVTTTRRRSNRIATLGIFAGLAGLVLIVVGTVVSIGAGLVALGLAAAAVWYWTVLKQRLTDLLVEQTECERRAEEQASVAQASKERRRNTEAKLAEWGYRATPDDLLRAAERLDSHASAERALSQWEARNSEAQSHVDNVAGELADRLRRDGWQCENTAPQALLDAVQRVEDDIERRRRVAAQVERREQLVDQRHALRASLARLEEDQRRRRAFADALAEFLAEAAPAPQHGTVAQQLVSLRSWLDAAINNRERASRRRRLEDRRQALCGEVELESMRNKLTELQSEVDDGHDASLRREAAAIGRQEIAGLETELRTIEKSVDQSEGALKELSQQLATLPELDERVETARRRYQRLVEQKTILERAEHHLVEARKTVHSQIAPQLVRATSDRVALVTGGKYKSLDIDPEDLSVSLEVEKGVWRDASQLSFGTQEQIYLLLRTAVAEIVAPSDESCPLLLDDTTVHADHERTEALVSVMAELAQDRQVIAFSHEDLVRKSGVTEQANIIELVGHSGHTGGS